MMADIYIYRITLALLLIAKSSLNACTVFYCAFHALDCLVIGLLTSK